MRPTRTSPTRRTRSSAVALTILAALTLGIPGDAAAAPNGYVEMSDGVLIAVNVRMPDTFEQGERYPTIFEMSGYDGGSATGRTLSGDIADQTGATFLPLQDDSRQLTKFFNEHYVTIHASVRGTGCSGGEFDLFSWRSALDGREVIEWIAGQEWSDGKVGIMGHSYGGITGFMVAATRPPHLTAVTVSGLIDDLYRGITYPGGVSNGGFPVLWTGAIRPFYDIGGGMAPGIVRTQDETCMRNFATHSRTVVNDPILQGFAGDTDNEWWRARSLVTYADRIEVPIHISGAYQDEQTGPRFPHLFEMVRDVPKRLQMGNGDHGTQQSSLFMKDRVAWMDHWMRGIDGGFGDLDDDDDDPLHSSVVTFLELHNSASGLTPNGRKDSETFPLPDTSWTSYYLHQGESMSTVAPAESESSTSYLSGSPRQSWSYQAGPGFGPPFTTEDGPDELTFRTDPVEENTAIVGPITATLYLSTTALDTEIFVQLIDEGPDGSRQYLQRGMLRASHRAIDTSRSDYVQTEDGPLLYRPFHPHTNPTFVTPGSVNEYVVEIFPVGHVFRPDHRIVVKVHTPPAVDSYYAYLPRRGPAQNTLYHDAERPSRIMLPVVPLTGMSLGNELACGQQDKVRCVA